MICTNCGSEIPVGNSFCGSCGTKAPDLPAARTQQTSDQPSEKPAFRKSAIRPFKPSSHIQDDQHIAAGFQKSVHLKAYKQSNTYLALRAQYIPQYSTRPVIMKNIEEASKKYAASTAGLVLAIAAVLLSCTLFLNIPLAILSIVFSIVGLVKENSGKVKCVISLILALLSLTISIGVFAIGIVKSNEAAATQPSITFETSAFETFDADSYTVEISPAGT